MYLSYMFPVFCVSVIIPNLDNLVVHLVIRKQSHFQIIIPVVFMLLFVFQITRSIGDAYLKKAEFNREPLLAKFRLPKPFTKPILSPEPSISVHKLNSKDQFLIFASDGLWEHLSNQDAVDIVYNYPRNVSCII